MADVLSSDLPRPDSAVIGDVQGASLRGRPRGRRFEVFQRPGLPGLELHQGRDAWDALESHAHEAYDLVLVEAGARQVRHRGTSRVLGPGSLFINASGEEHAGASESGWSFRSLYLPPAYFIEANREVGGGERLPCFSSLVLEQPTVTERFLAACDSLAEGEGVLASESLLMAVLVETLLRTADGHPELPKLGHEPRAVRLVQEYLREHIDGNVGLDALVGLTGLSRFHLIRVFRAATGLAPHAWQLQLRIHWAKVLLTQGRSLVDVALETGFADQSHFTRKFKQVVGLPPGAFLRRVRGSRQASAPGLLPPGGAPET
jgi:AraC-like DNA-binding protein